MAEMPFGLPLVIARAALPAPGLFTTALLLYILTPGAHDTGRRRHIAACRRGASFMRAPAATQPGPRWHISSPACPFQNLRMA